MSWTLCGVGIIYVLWNILIGQHLAIVLNGFSIYFSFWNGWWVNHLTNFGIWLKIWLKDLGFLMDCSTSDFKILWIAFAGWCNFPFEVLFSRKILPCDGAIWFLDIVEFVLRVLTLSWKVFNWYWKEIGKQSAYYY